MHPGRREPRYRVHVAVRFLAARDFAVEYAENLSRGGLFLAGGHALEPRQEVSIEVSLPGYGKFALVAEVAHLLSPEAAAELHRRPGAGLAITQAPPEFTEALASYLHRLGRRCDAVVLVGDATLRLAIAEAGYRSLPMPPVADLVAAVARSDVPVIAALVPRSEVDGYATVAAPAGAADLILPVEPDASVDDLLAVLDERL